MSAPKRVLIDWIHPSYRDLVIDQLQSDPVLRRAFLEKMGIEGIKLALSEEGGDAGERVFPLALTKDDRKIVGNRCEHVANRGTLVECRELMDVLSAAMSARDRKLADSFLVEAASTIIERIRQRWNDESTILEADELGSYCRLSVRIRPLPPLPSLQESWDDALRNFLDHLRECQSGDYADPSYLSPLLDLLDVIKSNEPRFLAQVGYPRSLRSEFAELLTLLDEYDADSLLFDYAHEYRDEAARLESVVSLLAKIQVLDPTMASRCLNIISNYATAIDKLESEAVSLEFEEDLDDYRPEPPASFDIDGLFADL